MSGCEAAMIDGAGYLKTFTKIILPQCKSIIASLAILAFIDNWNMVEQPLIFLSDSAKYPLSVYLAYINEGDLGLAFASGVFLHDSDGVDIPLRRKILRGRYSAYRY